MAPKVLCHKIVYFIILSFRNSSAFQVCLRWEGVRGAALGSRCGATATPVTRATQCRPGTIPGLQTISSLDERSTDAKVSV